MHIAGHSGIKEDQPRYIALIALPVFTNCARSPEEALKAEGDKCLSGITGVSLIQEIADHAHPSFVRVADITEQ